MLYNMFYNIYVMYIMFVGLDMFRTWKLKLQ